MPLARGHGIHAGGSIGRRRGHGVLDVRRPRQTRRVKRLADSKPLILQQVLGGVPVHALQRPRRLPRDVVYLVVCKS